MARSKSSLGWGVLAILIVSTAVDLVFATGYVCSDDYGYFKDAESLVATGWAQRAPGLGGIRLTMTGWNAAIIALLGAKFSIVAISFIALHQALNAITYAVGRFLWSDAAGLIAALIVGVSPLTVLYAGVILPDIMMTIFVVLAYFAFVAAYARRTQGRGRPAALLMFLAGVSVGGSYLTKETGLILLPYFFFLWLACEGNVWRDGWGARRTLTALVQGGLFAVGFAVVFVGEYFLLSHLIERPFFRLGWTFDAEDSSLQYMVARAGVDPIERLKLAYASINDLVRNTFQWIAIASLTLFPLLRERRWSLLLLGVWLFGYLTWGSASLSHYSPPSIQGRYYTPILPIVALIIGGALRQCHGWTIGRVRPRVLRNGLTMAATVALVGVLLGGLRPADAMAGRQYRSVMAHAPAAALRRALAEQDGPVVMSATVAGRVAPLIPAGSERLIAAEGLSAATLYEMASVGPVVYVFADATPGSSDFAPSCLDSALHALFDPRTTAPLQCDDGPVYANWCPEPTFPHLVQIGECAFWVSDVRRSSHPKSRVGQLRGIITGDIVDLSGSESSYWAGAVTLEAADAWAPAPPNEVFDLAAEFEGWGVARTDNSSMAALEDGGYRIDFTALPDEHAWLMPGRSVRRGRTLTSGHCWDVELDVELEGDARVEWTLTLDHGDEDPRAILRRYRLTTGCYRLSILPSTRPLDLDVVFKLRDSGAITIRTLRIVRRDPSVGGPAQD